MAKLLLLYASLLSLVLGVAAIESITITKVLPTSGHNCLNCLYHTLLSDVGNHLGCESPRDNRCYCAEPEASVELADEWFVSCANSRCGSGDISRDLTSMRSIYASYCSDSGFTQTGVEGWASAESTSAPDSPSGDDEDSTPTDSEDNSGNSDQPATKTLISVVTQTVGGGAAATQFDATVESTSTVWVNPDGSIADNPGSGSGSGDNSKWKIAVGVAVPLVAIFAAVAAWILWKKRRARKAASVSDLPTSQPLAQHPATQPSPPTMTVTPMTEASISRKPVASPTISSVSNPIEVTGEGHPQELSPQYVDAIATAPPAFVGGQHEMQGSEIHSNTPRAEVTGVARSFEVGGVYERPRSELPGSERFHHRQ